MDKTRRGVQQYQIVFSETRIMAGNLCKTLTNETSHTHVTDDQNSTAICMINLIFTTQDINS